MFQVPDHCQHADCLISVHGLQGMQSVQTRTVLQELEECFTLFSKVLRHVDEVDRMCSVSFEQLPAEVAVKGCRRRLVVDDHDVQKLVGLGRGGT
eukprot:11737609-Heterocapsa_arctica.AAC.1